MLFLKARVIAALSGKDRDTIYRLANLENWRRASRKGVNSTYFAIEDAERSLGLRFSNEQIEAAREVFSDPAAIELEDHIHV